MRKPRKRGAPKVRQVNGCRFVVARCRRGWSAHCDYSDRMAGLFGAGGHYGAFCPSGHPSHRSARRGILSGLHDCFAPRNERGRGGLGR